MALTLQTRPLLLLIIILILNKVKARPPGLYWPSSINDHPIQTRLHLDENTLNGLNESELETFLFLLDKVEHPPPRIQQQEQQHYNTYYAPLSLSSSSTFPRINKRTGIHHLAPSSLIQKKSIDWSDYFGIDKREIKGESEEDSNQETSTSTRRTTTIIPISTTPRPDAKDDKERQEIMKEFYTNMAMAGNFKRRKRAIRNRYNNDTMDKDIEKVSEKLIWDALKLTGSHRDDKMNKDEFRQLKKELIRRISGAYDLEKLRSIFEGTNKYGQ